MFRTVNMGESRVSTAGECKNQGKRERKIKRGGKRGWKINEKSMKTNENSMKFNEQSMKINGKYMKIHEKSMKSILAKEHGDYSPCVSVRVGALSPLPRRLSGPEPAL